jgi:hypothetical protein
MHFVEFVEINIGSLNDFNLSDLDILDGVNRRNLLGDLLLNDLTGEKIENLSGVSLGNLLSNNIVYSLSDDLLLRSQSVVGLSLLVWRLTSKSNHEDSKNVSVRCLDVLNGFDECLSLFNERAEFVTSDIDSVETGEGLSSFGLVDDKFNFSPMEAVLVGSKVSLHLSNNSTLDAIFDFF